MRTIYGCIYGSHLYGVSNENSDLDYKYVYLLDSREYVKGKTNTTNTVESLEVKGKETKVEKEYIHIQNYANLLGQAQCMAMEMLFAPVWAWKEISPEWQELQKNYHRAVSRSIGPFTGYARSQAVKYSLKGEKLATLEVFLDWVKDKNRVPTDTDFKELSDLLEGRAGVRMWTDDKSPTLRTPIRLIDICGRSFGETTHFKLWRESVQKIYQEYGARAQEAKVSGGRDLKAMYHAVRIIAQANELLTTGRLTFPRPEAPLLLDIRQGRYSNDEVADIISDGMDDVNHNLLNNYLPDKADREWLQEWASESQRAEFFREIQ